MYKIVKLNTLLLGLSYYNKIDKFITPLRTFIHIYVLKLIHIYTKYF